MVTQSPFYFNYFMDAVKVKTKSIIDAVCNFFDTSYFALLLSLIELFCYFLGLDLALIVFISLCISFVFVFKKSLNCIFVLFLCLSSLVSLKNSPANTKELSTFYFQPSVYITCFIFIFLPVLCILIRFAKNLIKKRISIDSLFYFSLILGVSLLTNGIFNSQYDILNLMFGGFMFFFFVILFYAALPDLLINKKNITVISKQVSLYLFVPLIELFVYYLSFLASGIQIEGRLDVFLGWGNRNTIGMLLTILSPFLLFLIKSSKKIKEKIVFSLELTAVFVGVCVTFSRQAYLSFFLLICCFALLESLCTNGRKKNIFFIILGIWILGSAFLFVYFNSNELFKTFVLDDFIENRLALWQFAFNAFKKYPVFGSGFFYMGGDPEVKLFNIMPYCCHNTILQMLGSCGVFGIISYAGYRFFSIWKISKTFIYDKISIIFSLALIIFMSLVDIHIFDIFGTGIYIILLAFATSKIDSSNNPEINIIY